MTHFLRLAGLVCGLAPLFPAQAVGPEATRPVPGFFVRLQDAPAHAGPRERALASRELLSQRAHLARQWQPVLSGAGLGNAAGWRLQAVGASSHLLMPPRALGAEEAGRWQAALARQPGVAWVLNRGGKGQA